jgi:ribosomal protein L3 glutamine methyltransferase
VRLTRSDLFRGLKGKRYDLIVSNPPYVSEAEMRRLPAEYRHEPRTALAAAERGLAAIVRILAGAPRHLTSDGVLVIETGNSHAALARAFPEVPFVWLTTSSGDESVFLLTAADVARHAARFRRGRGPAVARARTRRAR